LTLAFKVQFELNGQSHMARIEKRGANVKGNAIDANGHSARILPPATLHGSRQT
jgi:hypothetical protein